MSGSIQQVLTGWAIALYTVGQQGASEDAKQSIPLNGKMCKLFFRFHIHWTKNNRDDKIISDILRIWKRRGQTK